MILKENSSSKKIHSGTCTIYSFFLYPNSFFNEWIIKIIINLLFVFDHWSVQNLFWCVNTMKMDCSSYKCLPRKLLLSNNFIISYTGTRHNQKKTNHTSLLVNCRAFLPSKNMLYSFNLGMISFLQRQNTVITYSYSPLWLFWLMNPWTWNVPCIKR